MEIMPFILQFPPFGAGGQRTEHRTDVNVAPIFQAKAAFIPRFGHFGIDLFQNHVKTLPNISCNT
jgi:hypothetical protein